MKYLGALIVSALSFVAASGVQAEALDPYLVVPDGRDYEIRLGTAHRNISKLSLYFVSAGNVSTAVEARASAPMGAKISARGGVLREGDPITALATSKLIQPHTFRTSLVGKKEHKEVALTPDSNPAFGSVYAWYHLHKDACVGRKAKSQYVTEVSIDLSGIDPAHYSKTFVIKMSLKEFKYGGDKVATIKPASDGLYKNEPILLMQTIDYANEYVNILTWKNGKVKKQKRIPVVKYVGYQGYSLSLARLRNQLNGGKATFELSNGGDVWGVCFKKTRTRQSANGYPEPTSGRRTGRR